MSRHIEGGPRAKCKRCERACHGHDKIIKNGVPCCTDCAKEIPSGRGPYQMYRLCKSESDPSMEYIVRVEVMKAILLDTLDKDWNTCMAKITKKEGEWSDSDVFAMMAKKGYSITAIDSSATLWMG